MSFRLFARCLPPAVLLGTAVNALPGGSSAPTARPLDRAQARRSVEMLADFYRETLLETHVSYVTDDRKPASALMMRKLFTAMAEKGWPRARWMALNGRPLNPENVPRDAFEIAARRALRGGETLVDGVEGWRYRAVAALPFTGPCLKCHWGDRPADYMGAISFTADLAPAPAPGQAVPSGARRKSGAPGGRG